MSRSRLLLAIGVVVIAVGIGGFIVYDQVLRGDSAAALTLPTASSTPAASSAPAASTAAGHEREHGSRDDLGWIRGRDLERGRGERRRLPRPRAAGQPARRERCGRADRPGHRLHHARVLRLDDDPDGRRADRRHDLHHLGQVAARQPHARRRAPDRPVPDRDVHPDQAGRDPGGGAGGDGIGCHPDRRPDPPRRHEVGRDPGQGAARQRQIQVAGSLTFPLSDYSITAPNIGGFIVSIADTGTLEFLVNFTKG